MGLRDILFGRRKYQPRLEGYWQTLSGYSPVFTSWDGELYESELCRAAIDCLARNSAKLKPTFQGTAHSKMRTRLKVEPNPFQSWYQYLYQLRTILEAQNNAFILPVYDDDGVEVIGFFPVLPSNCELREADDGEPWLRYTFMDGMQGALPLDECGILSKHQYKDMLFGSSNQALRPTLEVIHSQNQGINEGVKNSATFRFLAKVNNFSKPEDLAKERKRFNEKNLQGESGGILLFPNTYSEIRQIEQKPYTMDADLQRLIQQNVYTYFGVNEDVLQNKCIGDAWDAFYEGAVEPFAIQASEVHSHMVFSDREISGSDNQILFTSNRLQYMSSRDKLNLGVLMMDRGAFNADEARELFNLSPLPDGKGKQYKIRGEYKDADGTPGSKDPAEEEINHALQAE